LGEGYGAVKGAVCRKTNAVEISLPELFRTKRPKKGRRVIQMRLGLLGRF
jgi:hypothetical protein